MSSQTLKLPDGRQLGYAQEGKGTPVVYFHGTASSRLEVRLLKKVTRDGGLRFIGIDRPGYGLSTFKDRIRLSDFASDVNALADHLGLDSFAILSWSGGGVFALPYTARNIQRVTRIVAVGCPSLPFDPSVAHNNNPLAKFAMKSPLIAKFGLNMFRQSVFNANHNIENYLASRSGKRMVADWPKPDACFFADLEWLKLMYGAMEEGFRQDGNSVKAVYQEHSLFMKPWNEPLSRIPPGKVMLWQGVQDKTCSVENAQKIAQIIKGVKVEIFPTEGHCVMFSQTDKLVKALKA
ncbi:MAG: alpha/beta hydrolase [Candidatus Bathyarchaeota archaeon]|nr:alpha/beta hydrolase [Candidatus Bathyarchaeota archaeon]